MARSIPLAVDEVGGPTILATLTVIAALLPMAFVTGLMGPYMSPIPINASLGMLMSLAIAFTRYARGWRSSCCVADAHHEDDAAGGGACRPCWKPCMQPFLRGRAGRPARWLLAIGLVV